jgi:hypothetical protein
MAEMLKSPEVTLLINEIADEVHAAVAAHPSVVRNAVETEVIHYTTDRASAAVDMDHPAGVAIEAKYGVLKKAARAAGLKVRARK